MLTSREDVQDCAIVIFSSLLTVTTRKRLGVMSSSVNCHSLVGPDVGAAPAFGFLVAGQAISHWRVQSRTRASRLALARHHCLAHS